MYVFVALVFAVYGGVGFYIGLRTAQWLAVVLPRPVPAAPYWAAVAFLASAFPLSRLAAASLPLWAAEWLARIGGWWMTAYVYLFPALLMIDLVRLVYRRDAAGGPGRPSPPEPGEGHGGRSAGRVRRRADLRRLVGPHTDDDPA